MKPQDRYNNYNYSSFPDSSLFPLLKMSVATRMRLGTIFIFLGFSLYKCHVYTCQMCPVQAVLAVSMELLGPLHLLRSESAACLSFHIVMGYCAAL